MPYVLERGTGANFKVVKARVSFVVVTYNSQEVIGPCLKSIDEQSAPPDEVLVVDNRSSDETVRIVRERFRSVQILENGSNLGYGAANNRGASRTSGEIIVFANPDVTLTRNWCREIAVACDASLDRGAAEGKLLLANQPGLLNCRGSYVNLLGFGCSRGYGEADRNPTGVVPVSFPSGAAFGIRREAFEEIEGFDERYFLYHEDVDLGLRLWAHGWKVVHVPTAVAYHDHDNAMQFSKLYYLERNRWLSLVKDMPQEYFVRCGPLTALGELAVFWYTATHGLLRAKVAASIDFMSGLPEALNERRRLTEKRPGRVSALSLLTCDLPMSVNPSGRIASLSKSLLTRYKKAFFSNTASIVER